ncbi:MAG: GGDEF domain-containing protein [Lachnospiraceae bacterium]|nr:GGDEF domain-containing protein [Lachnospiraceae bacterium]
MAYGSIPLDKRLKDNIRNYKLDTLFDIEVLLELLKSVNKLTGVAVMMTERHGEKALAVGDWTGFEPDVESDPGIKLRIYDRTVAHIYVKYDAVEYDKIPQVKTIVERIVDSYEKLGDRAYRTRELEIYTDELEEKLQKESYQAKTGEKNDELTEMLNHTYFENRLKIIDRSQVIPVAGVCININDWKYVNDNFGDEESDRLISTVAGIIRNSAKPDYVIGRVDGDVFNVIIPMPANGECEEFCNAVQKECDAYEDPHIAPSVAVGYAVKENVETSLSNTLADAEYAMFENKIEIKNAPGYYDRLHKA